MALIVALYYFHTENVDSLFAAPSSRQGPYLKPYYMTYTSNYAVSDVLLTENLNRSLTFSAWEAVKESIVFLSTDYLSAYPLFIIV